MSISSAIASGLSFVVSLLVQKTAIGKISQIIICAQLPKDAAPVGATFSILVPPHQMGEKVIQGKLNEICTSDGVRRNADSTFCSIHKVQKVGIKIDSLVAPDDLEHSTKRLCEAFG